MGSSESGGNGVADSGAGSIVWVRRRNGSWWPGKILGPDELSATHLMSPRSGTPVKLLGREDASVDWYNLEKSKRVKAFRCGEFDDCIERAEASLGLPAKKREKYARREDAILHALELEKQFFEKKYGRSGACNFMRENSSDSERKDLASSSGALVNGNGKLGNHTLYKLDKKDISNRMERNIPLRAYKATEISLQSLQEHSPEVGLRVRGLQEFGLRTVPVNTTICASAALDGSNRMAIDSHAYAASANDHCLQNSSDSDSKNSLGKRKRLLEGFLEVPLPKRHGRHHAELLNHSLRPDGELITMYGKEQKGDGMRRSMYLRAGSPDLSDANLGPQEQVQASHPQHGTFAEETTSGSSEETESDSSETHSLDPHLEAGMLMSDAETGMRAQQTVDRLEMQGGHESTSGDESDESLEDRLPFYRHNSNPSSSGVSKWKLKGKRNVRNIGKRPTEGSTHSTYFEDRGRSLSQRAPVHNSSYYHDNDYSNGVDFIEDDFGPGTPGFGKRGYFPSRATEKRQNFLGQNMIDWEDLTWGRPFRGGYWEERGGFFNPTLMGRNGHGMLIDVDLQVQANRQGGEPVPWVSLMSRLNGKAIIGHPLQIEALEDGSTDILFSISDSSGDRNRVPPVWSTARRTASVRVPRPHASSRLDGDNDEDADNQYFHPSRKAGSKKSSSSRKGSLKKKTTLQGMKKPSRKVSSSTNQKTKALSSIGLDQKFGNKRENDTSYYMDGVLKPVDSGPPAVACIPVKLVFSRLLEAVGRQPSGPAKHGGFSQQQ